MASDKFRDKNHTLSRNVQVKTEPGTSLPVPLRNIKSEPGVAPTTTRLTSFRVPRDLTLGGNIKTEKPKKVYVPNLNVQRNKKKEEVQPVSNEPEKSPRQKNRGRGHGFAERGRGRGSNNLIQTAGIFSQGPMDMPNRRKGGGERYGDDSGRTNYLEKPKLDLNREIDKDHEERKLKALLRDDFIDEDTDASLENAPVMLPLIEEAKLYKTEPKEEVSIPDDEKIDQKPIILENGEVVKPKKEIKKEVCTKPESEKEKVMETVSEAIENKAQSYILMQFPDCLPGLVSTGDTDTPTSKNMPNTSSERDSTDDTKSNYCTFNNLKPGFLGKLQILKSGKARLCLGENNLIVDVGSNISFRQDVLAAKLDTIKLTGELINLGPITSTLICSPDWESMLNKL